MTETKQPSSEAPSAGGDKQGAPTTDSETDEPAVRGTTRRGGRSANRAQRSTGIHQLDAKPFRNRIKPVEFFSADELESIHQASLEVLRDVGMMFLHQGARDLLRKNGADVNDSTEVVKFDPALIETWIAKVPPTFNYRSRNPETCIDIGTDRVVFSPVSSPPNCSDLDKGHRVGSFQDYQNLIRLSQTFNVLEFIGGYPVEPQDIPPNTRHLDAVRCMLFDTDKPINSYCLGAERIHDGIELTKRACGITDADLAKDAWLLSVVNTSSPLRLDANMIEGMFAMSEYNQPVIITPFTLSGAMAPATVAGAVVQQNAEALAAISLLQMMRPGQPCVYGGFTSNVDMKSGAPAFGTPEYFRSVSLGGQLTRRYKIPYRSSNTCAANAVDSQAAYESMFSLWAVILGGAHIVKHGAGWMEGGLVANYEKLVLDVELIQQFRYIMDPIALDADGLALDAIREVGTGGHFFGTAHTIERYETAFYDPMVSDWRNFGGWEAAGSPEAKNHCNRIWKEALASFEAPPLDPSRREAVDEYVELRREAGGADTMPDPKLRSA